ncbi:MAG: PucR family transcriptional regulator [Oscillospiraceae bacterium]
MAITLASLCANTEKTYGMKLVAGKSGLGNFVRWVHIVEDSEVPDFLHGNELVFTTGIGHRGSGWLMDFVQHLFNRKAAGLVINIGPYINSVPKEVADFCEKSALPLFVVPWSVKLIDITYDFCHRIVTNEENETSLAGAFRNLFFSPDKREGYAPVLERRGFHDVSGYTLLAAVLSHPEHAGTADEWRSMKFLVRKLCASTQYPSCIFIQENNLIIIRQHFPPQEAQRLAEQLAAAVADNSAEPIRVHVGISGIGLGFDGIHTCYHEAISAMRLASMKKCTVMHYHDIGVYKLLFGVESSRILSDYVDSTIGTLLDYDAKNSTDYAGLLRCYFENDCSVKEVADIFGVHRNTVNYKLKQIRELLGSSFSDEDKMNLLLAFRAHELLNTESSKLIMEDDSYECN